VERYIGAELAVATADARPLRAVLGLIDAEQPSQPGVIVLQQGQARAFWAPTVDPAGTISRIFGYTIVPPPSTARRLDVAPDAAPKGPAANPAGSDALRGVRFRAAQGPIRFHGFAVSHRTAETWLRPKLAYLTRRFPGSEASVHVHDRADAEAPIRAATREKRHFEIVSYPAICVERGGNVYRTGRARQDVEAIVADVNDLLGEDATPAR
jgi:hypothetical protein